MFITLTLLIFTFLVTLVPAAAAAVEIPLEEEELDDNTKTNSFSEIAHGCILRVNGDLGEPQPVYLRSGKYLESNGPEGLIYLNTGEELVVACTGTNRVIVHPNITATVSTAVATCVSDNLIAGDGWLEGNLNEFLSLTCSSNSYYEAEYTGETCWNNNRVVRYGFEVEGEFYTNFHTCFDSNRYEAIYAVKEMNPSNAHWQTGVTRPSWRVGTGFYIGVPVTDQYSEEQQKLTIANLVGDELADKYVTSSQYLVLGHLAAKTDFVFATAQRATMFFTNAAPQWQRFNAGNWQMLEANLKARIGEAGYYTTVYTGTFGILQLRDTDNNLNDVYLHTDVNNNGIIPVPLYFYKVAYDQSRRRGTAFIGINNPYITEEEAKTLTFCTDRCRNNDDFSWLRWQPDRIDISYSFCCELEEFQAFIPHLPIFVTRGLLF